MACKHSGINSALALGWNTATNIMRQLVNGDIVHYRGEHYELAIQYDGDYRLVGVESCYFTGRTKEKCYHPTVKRGSEICVNGSMHYTVYEECQCPHLEPSCCCDCE